MLCSPEHATGLPEADEFSYCHHRLERGVCDENVVESKCEKNDVLTSPRAVTWSLQQHVWVVARLYVPGF